MVISDMLETARASNGKLQVVSRPVDVEKDAGGDVELAREMGKIIESRLTKEA